MSSTRESLPPLDFHWNIAPKTEIKNKAKPSLAPIDSLICAWIYEVPRIIIIKLRIPFFSHVAPYIGQQCILTLVSEGSSNHEYSILVQVVSLWPHICKFYSGGSMSHHHGLWSSLVLYEVGNFMPRFNGSSLWTCWETSSTYTWPRNALLRWRAKD